MTVIAMVAATSGTLAAAWSDARTGRIPNVLSRGTACAAFACAAAGGDAAASAWGAALVGYGLFALYAITSGSGLGLGDVKLGVAIGAGLGPEGGAAAIGVAFVAGGVFATWLLAARRARRRDAIAFGPFLAGGTLAAAILYGWLR